MVDWHLLEMLFQNGIHACTVAAVRVDRRSRSRHPRMMSDAWMRMTREWQGHSTVTITENLFNQLVFGYGIGGGQSGTQGGHPGGQDPTPECLAVPLAFGGFG
jgi:hypothetical protein